MLKSWTIEALERPEIFGNSTQNDSILESDGGICCVYLSDLLRLFVRVFSNREQFSKIKYVFRDYIWMCNSYFIYLNLIFHCLV